MKRISAWCSSSGGLRSRRGRASSRSWRRARSAWWSSCGTSRSEPRPRMTRLSIWSAISMRRRRTRSANRSASMPPSVHRLPSAHGLSLSRACFVAGAPGARSLLVSAHMLFLCLFPHLHLHRGEGTPLQKQPSSARSWFSRQASRRIRSRARWSGRAQPSRRTKKRAASSAPFCRRWTASCSSSRRKSAPSRSREAQIRRVPQR
jgi:hypothetical protein